MRGRGGCRIGSRNLRGRAGGLEGCRIGLKSLRGKGRVEGLGCRIGLIVQVAEVGVGWGHMIDLMIVLLSVQLSQTAQIEIVHLVVVQPQS